MAEITYSVRLLERRFSELYDDGNAIEDLKMEFDLIDLGNTIPLPGDCIVSPWASGDRRDPANRTIYEVKERYFMPANIDESKGGRIYIGLIVQARQGFENETEVCVG